jgi:hypothetical protein
LHAPARPDVPEIPNPDARVWHPLTVRAWTNAWESAMSTQWLDSDVDGLGRVAVLWDDFNKRPDARVMAEIRLQESRFGLSPLDRSRLQWEIKRGEDAERGRAPLPASSVRRGADLRKVLKMVSG